MARTQLELPNEVASELAGPGDTIMKTLEGHLDCDVFLRGNVLTLDGAAGEVAMAESVVRELSDLVRQGHEIAPGTIDAITDALDHHESPGKILEDVVWRHRGKRVAPKTVNQKHYVDAIRRQTITVGIGPAGTGKSFLAVAMAVAALSRREVNRIVLTRPAVEAGERLGFLPGDLMAKVDPYLRPLFDALYDMLEPERVNHDLERGQRSGLVVIGDILGAVDGIEFVRFGGQDVVRHKLVQRIVAAYDEYASREAPALR